MGRHDLASYEFLNMPNTVRVTRVIDAPRRRVWDALTEPSRLALWFADLPRFGPNEPFRFEFGDGDFFVGRTLQWDERNELRLVWRFMDVGPLFHIRYRLDDTLHGATRVTVTDRGALLESEVESLRVGWADFLNRLDCAVTTGRRARFKWSPTICAGAFVHDGIQPFTLMSDAWLSAFFPGASIGRFDPDSGDLLLRFNEPSWGRHITEARLEVHSVEARTLVALTHDGWDALPLEAQLAERRRYAKGWAEALASMEAALVVH